MVSSSGNANLLGPKRNGNGLSRFISDARTTSLRARLAVVGHSAIQIDYSVRNEFKSFAVLSVVVDERLFFSQGPLKPPNDAARRSLRAQTQASSTT